MRTIDLGCHALQGNSAGLGGGPVHDGSVDGLSFYLVFASDLAGPVDLGTLDNVVPSRQGQEGVDRVGQLHLGLHGAVGEEGGGSLRGKFYLADRWALKSRMSRS